MEEAKDSAIKLFGRTILLPEVLVDAAETVDSDLDESIRSVEERDLPSDDLPDNNHLNGDDDESEEESAHKDSVGATATTTTTTDANTEPNGINQNSESTTIDDVTTTTSSKDDQEHETKSQDNNNNNNNKTLKKPDKILPCPRCQSMDTKFCYYNNYNVNQPRHYCKRCQRYWTAGGIMRNVPIGAGRRKNKNLIASQCTHVNLSEAVLNPHHGHLSNGTHSNHAVLNFGYDQGRLQEFQDTGKTLTKSKKDDASNEEQSDDLMQYSRRVPPPQAWPYPWNPIQWNSSLSAVASSPSGFQLPFYPSPPFWGCSSVPSVWNVPNSQTLGKHSRDNNVVKRSNPEKEEGNPGKCFWVPKPLRIDDLGEAARSSIWKTLGIKMDKSDLVGEKGGFLKTSSVLQANPAAFSRSLNFRENT